MNRKNKISTGLTIVILIAVAVVFMYSVQESPVEKSDTTIRFGGMYGTTIELDEITDVELRDSLPKIGRRVNGAGIGSVRKGFFNIEEFGRARLLLHANEGPYIVFQTTDEVVIINFRDGEKTRTEYNEIAAMRGL